MSLVIKLIPSKQHYKLAVSQKGYRHKVVENIGTYTRRHQSVRESNRTLTLDITKFNYWLGRGAQPTKSTLRLLAMCELVKAKQKSST